MRAYVKSLHHTTSRRRKISNEPMNDEGEQQRPVDQAVGEADAALDQLNDDPVGRHLLHRHGVGVTPINDCRKVAFGRPRCDALCPRLGAEGAAADEPDKEGREQDPDGASRVSSH